MTTKYLYDGELSPQMADYIHGAMREYPNALELTRYPDHEWINANLPEYHWRERGATGGEYSRSSQKFCLLSKSLDGKPGVFFFVSTQAEKQKIIDGCPDLIVNANPFKTVF